MIAGEAYTISVWQAGIDGVPALIAEAAIKEQETYRFTARLLKEMRRDTVLIVYSDARRRPEISVITGRSGEQSTFIGSVPRFQNASKAEQLLVAVHGLLSCTAREPEAKAASKPLGFLDLLPEVRYRAVAAWKEFVNVDGSLDGVSEGDLYAACADTDYHFTRAGELYRDRYGTVL